jgi:hypothetical protein
MVGDVKLMRKFRGKINVRVNVNVRLKKSGNVKDPVKNKGQ